MKRLKTFEELNPGVYRRVGDSLYKMGKKNRGEELIDYGYKKEFGTYNINIANINGVSGINLEFTKPEYKITLTENIKDRSPSLITNSQVSESGVSNTDGIDNEKLVSDMLNNWHKGKSDLGFTINFWFTPLRKQQKIDYFFDSTKKYPVFSMKFIILSIMDDYGDTGKDMMTIWEEEKNEYEPGVLLEKPVGVNFGIFSDRKSANKFKREVYSKAIEDSKDIIVEIFSQLSGDTDQLERFLKLIENIRINRLYDDEVKIRTGSDFHRKWFNGNSIIPGTEWSDY
jgi:hypothetical protein